MSTDDPNRKLSNSSPKSLSVGGNPQLDLSQFPDETRNELARMQAEGLIEIQKKAMEGQVDVGQLQDTLAALTRNTTEITEKGASVTIEHETQSSIGKTRVVMGNTPAANRGSIAKQSGCFGVVCLFFVFVIGICVLA